MKINILINFVFSIVMLFSCDGIQERMEAERAYRENLKQQQEAMQSVWQFKKAGYDLKVTYSDDEVKEEVDKKELAQFTSQALREIADFPHLNITQTGGEFGTVSVHYQVIYANYLSEDKQLKWQIPISLVATVEVNARNKAGLWGGKNETTARVPSTVEQLSEHHARGHALDQYAKLIEASVSQLKDSLGKHPDLK